MQLSKYFTKIFSVNCFLPLSMYRNTYSVNNSALVEAKIVDSAVCDVHADK